MRKLQPTLKERRLEQITARDFSGGWNALDSELNLSSKYSIALYNLVPNDNGDLQVRWGTRKFADFTSVLGDIVATEYYFTYIIAVDKNGKIAAARADGTVQLVWDSTVAASLPGAPAGWGPTDTVSFTQFMGDLILTNGRDKPLLINVNLAPSYLQDLGTGTNINTPVAKYVVAHSNYVVFANSDEHPGRLYISSTGTSGTFPGDPAPNDAITFDLDKYVLDSAPEIVGLASYANKLVVFFNKWIVTLRLGEFTDSIPPVHKPVIVDNIASYGAVSHKAIVPTGDQVLFLDYTGISALRSNPLDTAGGVSPNDTSALIANVVRNTMVNLPREFTQTQCFAVHDKLEQRVLFFVPVGDLDGAERRVFVGSLKRGKKELAWSEFGGWNFRAGCVSVEGRVFFARGSIVYRYGSIAEPILSDYEGTDQGPSITLAANLISYSSPMDSNNLNWQKGSNTTRIGRVTNRLGIADRATQYSHSLVGNGYVARNAVLLANTWYTTSLWMRHVSGPVTNTKILSCAYNNGVGIVRADSPISELAPIGVWKRYSVTFFNVNATTQAQIVESVGAGVVVEYCDMQTEVGQVATEYNENVDATVNVARPYTYPRPLDAAVYPVVVNNVKVPDYGSGKAIKFKWELPWTELRDRVSWKSLHYIHFDTHGASEFTLNLYVDDLRKRQITEENFTDGTEFSDTTGWRTDTATPYASLMFTGGDRAAYNQFTTQGLRPTDDQRLYAMYARFRLLKLEITGESYSHLRFVGVTLYHTKGSIY
jgi:hypothetical protein